MFHKGDNFLGLRVYFHAQQDPLHYENMPIQIYWKLHHQKLKVFR